VAAGSLLEFVLSDHRFSMPVGRIQYLHMGPMTFTEYLEALDETKLRLKSTRTHRAEISGRWSISA
jgi:predicted AAA+ superfamily ATPase